MKHIVVAFILSLFGTLTTHASPKSVICNLKGNDLALITMSYGAKTKPFSA